MSWLAVLRVAARALQRNRLRSLLTMLGIIIGVGAVIAMVAIGQGANSAVQARIASMGTNVIAVWPGSTTSGGVRVGGGSLQTLTLADAWAIQRECPAVAAVAPSRRGTAQVIYGNQNWATVVLGTYPEYQVVRDWPVQAGQFFTQQDVSAAAKAVVLGQTVADNLFGGEDPVGKIVRIKNIPFKVVGVLTPKGQSGFGQDQDDTVLIPFTTAERQVLRTQFLGTVGSIMVTAASAEAVQEAQEQITALLRQRHRLAPNQENDFLVRNFADVAAAAEETAGVMTLLLAAIASVSLIVGGIGIMNIMLVSVTERTREIGLRMAVGARNRDILLQFLVEAVVLCLAGGLIGVGTGLLASQVIGAWAQWPILISLPSIALAFVFSAAVGVFFGFYPARKASRLDPIEALRYE